MPQSGPPSSVDGVSSHPHVAASTGSRRLRLGAATAGIVVVVGATFAPWIASGTTNRSLYGAAGAGQRLLRLGGPAVAALAALPFVGLAFAAAMLLWLAGRTTAAAVSMVVLDVAGAAVAAATLVAPRSGPVHAVAVGPIILICGALINLAAILSAAIPRAVRARGARSRDTYAGSAPAFPLLEDQT